MNVLRYVFISIISLGSMTAIAQDYQRRAVKLTEKADEMVRDRNFDEAKQLLKKAIKADPAYPTPYMRLATIYSVYLYRDSAALYYNELVKVAPASISEKVWHRIAGLNFSLGDYDRAFYAINKVDKPDSLLQQSIEFSLESIEKGIKIEIEDLPATINAFQLQYFPVLTIDEGTIIYTKRDSDRPSADEDIVISKKINGEWIPAQSISSNINSRFNEGACTISADGRTLIFTSCEGRASFGSCDLYISHREGNQWSAPQNLGSKVNSQYWDSQPALSADGHHLYFSSNRPGGVGKRDIWYSRLTPAGWSNAVNLGTSINTNYDETTPFVHANNELLFFSSEGHPGLGGFDLFVAKKERDKWLNPQNLQYPINTFEDELSLFINADASRAYYAKEYQVHDQAVSKLVSFKFPMDTLVTHRSSYVTGRVFDASSGEPIGADFTMADLADSTDTYQVRSDSVTGRYFLVLTQGKHYGVFISKKGYLFEDLSFQATGTTALSPDTVDIPLSPIRIGFSMVLENIYFDFDSYHLNPSSRMELEEMVSFLQENERLRFEIQGHTDDHGSHEYNMTLSEKRAESIYNYLRQRGIRESLMSYRGYGSTDPLVPNSSEENRARNRRIAFKVLNY